MKIRSRLLAGLLAALLLVLPAAYAAGPDELLACPNADPAVLTAYASYWEQHPTFSAQQAVTFVNIGLNRPFYSRIEPVEDPDELLVLVNKYHSLSSQYVPSDLVALKHGGSGVTLRAEAAAAFDRMADAARADGVVIQGVSGYRSYSLQNSLYSRYSAKDGRAAADRYSARPGHSEHQTGLAIDVNNGGVYTKFGGTAAHSWAVKHLHEYGFIIRYTRANEWITGYKDEAWHFRYVGVQAATEIYHLGLTLEEYLDRYVAPTGSSTAQQESLEQLRVTFGASALPQPGSPTQLSLTFSNVLVPVSGTARWEIDGVPVPGTTATFTAANGASSTLRYLTTRPDETHKLTLALTVDGCCYAYSILLPAPEDQAFWYGVCPEDPPVTPASASLWRSPRF